MFLQPIKSLESGEIPSVNSLVPPTQVKWKLSVLPSKKTTFVDSAGVDAFVDSIEVQVLFKL